MLDLRITFIAFVLLVFSVPTSLAQSGRQKQKASSPKPSVIAEQTRAIPDPSEPPYVSPKISSLIVTGDIVHGFGYMSSNYMDIVFKEFTTWMKYDPQPFMSLTTGGKMKLENAAERAKKETDNHVLWMGVVVEDNGFGQLLVTGVDYRIMIPRSGKVLTSGKVVPGKQKIIGQGGVLAVPTMPKRSSDLAQMKQAARAVAGSLKNSAWFR